MDGDGKERKQRITGYCGLKIARPVIGGFPHQAIEGAPLNWWFWEKAKLSNAFQIFPLRSVHTYSIPYLNERRNVDGHSCL